LDFVCVASDLSAHELAASEQISAAEAVLVSACALAGNVPPTARLKTNQGGRIKNVLIGVKY
jgi:hypothetical protein